MEINPLEVLSGVNPIQNIPDLYFEMYRLRYVVSLFLKDQKEEDFVQIKANAEDFATQMLKQKFPNLEIKLKPEMSPQDVKKEEPGAGDQ